MATAVLDSLIETVSLLPEQEARTVLDFARFLLERKPAAHISPIERRAGKPCPYRIHQPK